MKKGWLILSFLFFIQPVLPVLEYVVNYDYIVEVLCINRENPELQCNGKCHLGKELAKTLDDPSSSKDNKIQSIKLDFQLFWQNVDELILPKYDGISQVLYPFERTFIHEPHILIFSPPPQLI
ncbi:MAG: hypothetical protein ACR2MS_03590 [Weeksellaceae bacterium]